MNLNKFRDIKPDEKAMKDLLDKISENDAEYIEKLQKLKYKKSNNGKIIQIVSAVAAAVVLVAAFSLWALLGRGIRIIGDTPGAPDDEINYNIYTVTVSHDGKLIDGKDMLQGFFDDYVSGRMCTLEMVHMDRPGIMRAWSRERCRRHMWQPLYAERTARFYTSLTSRQARTV